MVRILVIHGPNLNLLGQREMEIYGRASLEEINGQLQRLARELSASVEFFQSNHEGEIVDRLQKADGKFDAVVLNAAGFTHTSVAIRDAVAAVSAPVVEVHLSNIHAREEFRKESFLSPVVGGVIFGFGVESYLLGFRGAVALAERQLAQRKGR